jgi:hypothetical protein
LLSEAAASGVAFDVADWLYPMKDVQGIRVHAMTMERSDSRTFPSFAAVFSDGISA